MLNKEMMVNFNKKGDFIEHQKKEIEAKAKAKFDLENRKRKEIKAKQEHKRLELEEQYRKSLSPSKYSDLKKHDNIKGYTIGERVDPYSKFSEYNHSLFAPKSDFELSVLYPKFR